MFTPQQLEEISFPRVRFNGYSMDAVDGVLEPLIADYTALCQENTQMKSKLRVLVEQLEEYRGREADLRASMLHTQTTCDQMIQQTEAKCAQMLQDAAAAVAERERSAAAQIAAAELRVEEARRTAAERVGDILGQLSVCTQLLERLRAENQPAEAPRLRSAHEDNTDAVARQISNTLEAMVGPADNFTTML